MQCIRYGLFRGKNVCTCLAFTLKLFQNLKLKAFKFMILVDFHQLKKNSGQKFDNSLHSNALFLIFIFTFEIKTFFFMLKTICKRTFAGAATLFYQCSLL